MNIFIIIACAAAGIALQNINILIASVFAFILSVYINYQISWKWIIELKKDLRAGHKLVEKLRVVKIKSTKASKEVIMNNGLNIDFFEFEAHDIETNDLDMNSEFEVSFTPNNKFILDIKTLN
ncbi:hypothetical protein [Echinicola sp. 20G]|uniref:hypothetical protein n=1 Tax=Echinicola sp. 20G TaxID=2781961 RepID=UPI00191041CB|nr:hypothetical protein [Echinicola sp. 20G]